MPKEQIKDKVVVTRRTLELKVCMRLWPGLYPWLRGGTFFYSTLILGPSGLEASVLRAFAPDELLHDLSWPGNDMAAFTSWLLAPAL